MDLAERIASAALVPRGWHVDSELEDGGPLNTRVLDRIAAVLILLFDVGHSASLPWSDPGWKVDLGPMRSSRFDVLGFSRTYWDFYVGFGLFVSLFLLLAAILAWQLGSLPPQALRNMRWTRWALATSFAAVAVLSCLYFFIVRVAFGVMITVCLVAAVALPERAA